MAKSKMEEHDFIEYGWNVLLSEVLTKIYADYFGLSREEAENRLNNTPEKLW